MSALFLLIPLAGIILSNLFGRQTSEKLARIAAFFSCGAYIFLAATSGCAFWQGPTQWLNALLPFGARLQIDFLSAAVLATVGLIALISLVLSLNEKNAEQGNFANLLMIAMMGMSGIVLVRDIFTLYIFLEITAVSSFILIAIEKKRDSLEGAFKYLIMSALATVMVLAGIALIFLTVGRVDFASVAEYFRSTPVLPFQMILAFVLFIAGLSVKAGAVPFHGWLPDAYSSAPSPVSVMLAGIVTKVTGVYTILRFVQDVFAGNSAVSLSFMVLGTISILAGAVAAFGQSDFKRMLAYSSISQVGYIILAAGLANPLGMIAALLHFFNHAVFKSLLFVNSAAVETSAGTREMDQLGGLAQRMPVTAGTSVVGFLSTAGIPPLAGFWSKLLIILALFQAGKTTFAAIALLASLLTLAYFLVMQRKMFFGKLKEEFAGIREAGAAITVPALVLAAVTVLFGLLFPFILMLLQAQGLI